MSKDDAALLLAVFVIVWLVAMAGGAAGVRAANCRRSGCDHVVEVTMLACARHWLLLPPELRRRITRLWSNVLHARAERHPRTLELASRYRLAVEEADEVWNG